MEITEPGYYSLTIKSVVESVYQRKLLLPAIQREFVWSTEQMIKLFDSLMRGYPIGSFLFWTVSEENINKFDFYEFIKNYHEKKKKSNPKANISGESKLNAVLDGQQRLTALFIGLKGSYAEKIPRKQWSDESAFPEKKLYINILSKPVKPDLEYDFQFLKLQDAIKQPPSIYWFEVSKILEFKNHYDISTFLREEKIIDFQYADKCLTQLFSIIVSEKLITYYLVVAQDLNKILNIFIRINSGGTQLSNSDLLLSTSIAKWKDLDARKEITEFVDEINSIGDGFLFNKDFILKSCLVLIDLRNIAYRVDNFNKENMEDIETKWNEIKAAIRMTVELVSSFGYNFQNLTSNNALIPIAYYILKKDVPRNFLDNFNYINDRNLIRKWLNLSLIKRAFSGQPDNVLRPIRTIIKENLSSFPLGKIVNHFRGGNKSLIFFDDDIQGLLSYKYGQKHTFSVLSLLYPDLNYTKKFHQDHIYPKAFFKKRELTNKGVSEKDIEFYQENYNFIGNLQLLKGIKNEMKGSKDFLEWCEEQYPNESTRNRYFQDNHIPSDISLNFDNFRTFLQKRKNLLFQEFQKILKLSDYEEESEKESELIEISPPLDQEEIFNKYSTKRKFVHAEIRRIIKPYHERIAGEVIEYCDYILLNKTKLVCHKLSEKLNKNNRKKISFVMIKEVKENDSEMKNIELNTPLGELEFNYSRIWHIIKDMMSDAWISSDAMNFLRNYLEKWLIIQAQNAIKKMKLRAPNRITLKVEDFKI